MNQMSRYFKISHSTPRQVQNWATVSLKESYSEYNEPYEMENTRRDRTQDYYLSKAKLAEFAGKH
jgi:hypothetical protein